MWRWCCLGFDCWACQLVHQYVAAGQFIITACCVLHCVTWQRTAVLLSLHGPLAALVLSNGTVTALYMSLACCMTDAADFCGALEEPSRQHIHFSAPVCTCTYLLVLVVCWFLALVCDVCPPDFERVSADTILCTPHPPASTGHTCPRGCCAALGTRRAHPALPPVLCLLLGRCWQPDCCRQIPPHMCQQACASMCQQCMHM